MEKVLPDLPSVASDSLIAVWTEDANIDKSAEPASKGRTHREVARSSNEMSGRGVTPTRSFGFVWNGRFPCGVAEIDNGVDCLNDCTRVALWIVLRDCLYVEDHGGTGEGVSVVWFR